VFGCEKKVRREKKVRKSVKREKQVRNRVDLIGCLIQEKDRRDREERSVDYFEMYQNTPN